MFQNRMKIILVEDNAADAILIERQIKRIVAMPEIIHITRLQELKDKTNEYRPDIVLCDYQLVGFTGLEVLEYINSLDYYIPVIFITGTIKNEELAANTILTGAAGYILKKNINTLHERLLPYFTDIIEAKVELQITSEHKMVLEEMESHLKELTASGKMNTASFLEIKRTLAKIKSLNQHSES